MCGPIAPIMAVASAVIGAAGTIMQGQAAAGQASYQAQVARNNQIIAERNAVDAEKRGVIDEDKMRRRVASIAGTQRAQLAGQGSVLDEGSPLDIQMDTAGLGELDALTVRGNSEREAYGFRVQGMNQGAQAALYDSKTSTLGSWLSAGGSILGGAAQGYKAFGFGGGGSGAVGEFGSRGYR
jgi:hypothetical protein